MSDMLLVSEVAERLRVSDMTVYRLVQSGDIAALRIGRSYRIRSSELEDYLKRNEVEA